MTLHEVQVWASTNQFARKEYWGTNPRSMRSPMLNDVRSDVYAGPAILLEVLQSVRHARCPSSKLFEYSRFCDLRRAELLQLPGHNSQIQVSILLLEVTIGCVVTAELFENVIGYRQSERTE
jgi:hypothetical protein